MLQGQGYSLGSSGDGDALLLLSGGGTIELNGIAPAGIQCVEHAEIDGAMMFAHACRMGLEGIVSKRRDFPYRSGRTKTRIKIKNPAMLRV